MSFVYQSLPGKVIFANGAITQARTEAAALGMQRVLVLYTPSKLALAERVAAVILPHVVAYNRLQAGDLDQVADLATRNPYYNPRPVERTGVRKLLQAAFDGTLPASL